MKIMVLRFLISVFLVLGSPVLTYAEQSHSSPANIVIIGPPGSGKGTLAAKLSEDTKLPVLTISQMLKSQMQSDPALKSQVEKLMSSGQLVPDSIIMDALKKELVLPKYAQGVIFDGFPRTLGQTKFFEETQRKVSLVIIYEMSDEDIVKRMQGRRVHEPSGRMYHIDTMPPKIPGKDDITGEDLVQRQDDQEEIVKKRLGYYRTISEPVARWFILKAKDPTNEVLTQIVVLDGNQDFKQVWKTLCARTKQAKNSPVNCQG